MDTRLHRPAVRLVAIAIAAACSPAVATAQDADQLRKELESAKAMIRQMEERLKALEAAQAAKPAGTRAPALVVEKTTTIVKDPVIVVFDPQERFNDNGYGDPRPEGRDRRAEKKGFIDLQGTDTSVKIGGFVKMDAMVDTNPIGTRDWLVPAAIPTTGPNNQQGPQFGMNARATRLNFEFRRNTEFGLAKIFLENDFFGDDAANFRPGPYGFRLRHAYGQLGPWTVGRTFSNFIDIDAWPDTLEFYGPAAATFLFNSQVRYTQALEDGLSASGAVETPKTDITCNAAATCGPRERMPDLTGKLRWEQPWGHLQGTALWRHLAYDTGIAGAGSATGLGLQLSGSWKSGIGNDYATFSAVTGTGIQRYINDPGYFGGNDGVVGPQGQYDALRALGGYVGYTHFWDEKYRSTFSTGFVDNENSAWQLPTAYNRSQYLTANVIWNVFGSLNVGSELIWAQHKDKAGNTGDLLRLMFSAQYNFVR